MLEGRERDRAEVVARRAVRAEEPPTDKQLKSWRQDIGDDAVDRLLKEQGA